MSIVFYKLLFYSFLGMLAIYVRGLGDFYLAGFTGRTSLDNSGMDRQHSAMM